MHLQILLLEQIVKRPIRFSDMVDICSNYLAQNAEYNSTWNDIINLLINIELEKKVIN